MGINDEWKSSISSYKVIFPKITDVGIGADGTVRIINSIGYIFTLTDTGWEENHNLGNASSIAVVLRCTPTDVACCT